MPLKNSILSCKFSINTVNSQCPARTRRKTLSGKPDLKGVPDTSTIRLIIRTAKRTIKDAEKSWATFKKRIPKVYVAGIAAIHEWLTFALEGEMTGSRMSDDILDHAEKLSRDAWAETYDAKIKDQTIELYRQYINIQEDNAVSALTGLHE